MSDRHNCSRRIAATLALLSASPCVAPARAEPKYADAPVDIALPPAHPGPVDFARDIAPLFTARCLSCHGPAKQRGGLRLDSRAALLKPGDDGPRLMPGDGAHSPLLLLTARGDDDRMPPPDSGPPLTRDELARLRAWIDAGAPWPEGLALGDGDTGPRHWAFVAPVRPAVPPVRDRAWVRNPIDAFVLARLEREGLRPAPPADPVTLLRRIYLDVIGLPPSPAEVETFVAGLPPAARAGGGPPPRAVDRTAVDAALDRVVARLLPTRQHGERWGQVWLDVARYADSDGYEKDKPRVVWAYRDWVIDALARGMPYDRFLTEQLAGDLLPGATQAQRVATGYLRNAMLNEEGGADPEQFRVEALFDRMDAIGKGILGLTIQCAQCHTHKYDPITQEEYYRLFAFLNQDDEASLAVYTAEQRKQILRLRDRIGRTEAALQAAQPDWRARAEAWARANPAPATRWTTLQAPFDDDTTAGQKYLRLPDGSFLAQSYAPTKHSARMTIASPLPVITALRIEQLPDPNLPLGGPGRSPRGTSALTELKLELEPREAGKPRRAIRFVRAEADFEQPERELEAMFDDRSGQRRVTGPPALAIDGKEDTAWGIDRGPGRRNAATVALFVPEAPIDARDVLLHVTLSQRHGGWNSDDLMSHNLGRFRISVTSDPTPALDRLPPEVRAALARPATQRTASDWAALFAAYRASVPAWRKANQEIEALWAGHPEPASTLVLAARPGGRPTHVFKRGDFLKPGDPVSPGVPGFLHPLPAGSGPLDRLALARWLTDRRSPTTARVIANRLWQTYFGVGLVATPEDLGTQGEPPSHPELLDWLAVELMDGGWRLDHLHRLITSSATYRQDARTSPELQARDPYNRLLARGARFRLDAEVLRDVQLAASGLIDPTGGGPPIMPPAPDHLFQPPASYAPFPWVVTPAPARYRRSVYVYRRRSTPYPMLATFDAPRGEAACPRRVRSNTPLQALMTLNEPTAMDAARALARRMVERPGPVEQRLSHGFHRVLARAPDASELATLTALHRDRLAHLQAGWADPWQLATGDAAAAPTRAQLPAGVTPTELAAYTLVARVLLNLDETFTRP